jgi:methionyl-tRNA formyltransferase
VLRIVFMGTPAFAVPSLQALLDLREAAGRPARVVAVVTQPDRPAGRGRHVQASPVKELALAAGVPVLQPERLRRPENVAALRAYRPDLVVVAAFAQILSRDVLAAPTYGCLNVHASLLPRWRGAAPIPAAILAGDPETGVTIMRMDPGLDTGPLLSKGAEPIRPDDTTATLTPRLAARGAALLTQAIGPYVAGTLRPQPQDEEGATLTRPLQREDGRVDWGAMPADLVARMTRAYDPWPGVYTTLGGRILKLWAAEAIDASVDGAEPGHALTREEAAPILQERGLSWPRLVVAAAGGLVLARDVQPEGKCVMGGDEYLRGQPGVAGARLGA